MEPDNEAMGETKQHVPYHRFKEVNDELKAARAKLAEYEPVVTKAADLERKLTELKDAHKAQIADLGTHLSMADAGLTDTLGREVARLVYSKLPEDGRPPMGDWLKGLRAEGADVPPPLRPYLTATSTLSQTPLQTPAKPNPTGTTGRAPPAAGNVTAQAIRDAESDFRRTGDRSAYETRLRELKVIT
jgi:hypothetical protein